MAELARLRSATTRQVDAFKKSRGDGIGRHAGFKNLCPQGHESSSLSRGICKIIEWVRLPRRSVNGGGIPSPGTL